MIAPRGMAAGSSPSGVLLPEGESASTLLLRLVAEAKDAFLGALGPVAVPDHGKALKRSLAPWLLHVEQRRLASPDATAMARHLARRSLEALRFVDESGDEIPLAELRLGEPFERSEAATGRSSAGWRPSVPFEGELIHGAELDRVIDALVARGHLDLEMAAALRRMVSQLDADGRLDLSGERFALLGAGAEIAPTRHLLEAGATVLWCDRVPPPEPLRAVEAGRLVHAAGASDLLRVPDRVAGTVARFAETEGPVHLGLFAYGPGQGREWRLAAAMNAITRQLPEASLKSVGLYVSPTSPAALTADEVFGRSERRDRAPSWQRVLRNAQILSPARDGKGAPPVADVIVPIQGVSYQAAQWLEKNLAMVALAADRPGLRVSANVAPITQTRSLEHPVFKVAFRGAPAFGVCAYPAAFTRTLSGLAYLHDALHPAAESFRPKHLHGGVFTLPYALESAIRVAAGRGLFGGARLS